MTLRLLEVIEIFKAGAEIQKLEACGRIGKRAALDKKS